MWPSASVSIPGPLWPDLSYTVCVRHQAARARPTALYRAHCGGKYHKPALISCCVDATLAKVFVFIRMLLNFKSCTLSYKERYLCYFKCTHASSSAVFTTLTAHACSRAHVTYKAPICESGAMFSDVSLKNYRELGKPDFDVISARRTVSMSVLESIVFILAIDLSWKKVFFTTALMCLSKQK